MDHAVGLHIFAIASLHEAPDPAILGGLALHAGGVPNVKGLEVRAVGIGVADALDDGHASIHVALVQRGEVGAKATVVVHLEGVLGLNPQHGTRCVVGIVRMGNDRVEPVVATGQLDQDQRAFGVLGPHGG